ACHECPFNLTDCFRPQCVTANGYPRPVITVNRMMPGPSIEVCEGDTVVVYVRNELEDGSATSIHWHGQSQFNTCHMDGVGLLTQCNIPYKETFRYEFTAYPAGTHWYHSHTGMQFADGLFGAFIVREPVRRDPVASLYEVDSSDHILVLQDFLDYWTIIRYMNEMHNMWEVSMPIAGLINGRGQKHVVLDEYHIINTTVNQSMTPREVFMVKANTSYRFRIISVAPRCPFILSVDSHIMTVIATDGAPLKPVIVDSLVIGSGERYDIVITANQNPGNFWIKCQGLVDCAPSDGHASAILRYEGAPEVDPPGIPTEWRQGTIFNPFPDPKMNRSERHDIYQDSLRYGGKDEDYSSELVDVKYYITLQWSTNDNTKYNHPVYYPVANLHPSKTHLTPTLNNIFFCSNNSSITYYVHPAPLLTQWNDVAADLRICNSSTVNMSACEKDLCYCTHLLDVKLGQIVELFMISLSDFMHPMHLHGYQFRVVGNGMFDRQKTAKEVIEMDSAGRIPRILQNPMHKDTIMVHGGFTYTIIRFKADNPGIWFLHCHTDGHLQQGMAMVIKVGNLAEFPTPPSYFPRCGGYTYRDTLYKDSSSLSWRLQMNLSTSVFLTIAAILLTLNDQLLEL
ncbi:hypothetical protein ACJMK2_038012, partial [Sinanodonta woodiana]